MKCVIGAQYIMRIKSFSKRVIHSPHETLFNNAEPHGTLDILSKNADDEPNSNTIFAKKVT